MSAWAGRRVLVTGANGFIGRRLIGQLVEHGAHVFAAVHPAPPLDWPGTASTLVFDIRSDDAVQAAVAQARPEAIFHLAAVGVSGPPADCQTAVDVNVRGTLHVLEAARRVGCQRLICTGTCYEYGSAPQGGLDPFNAYAASKVAAWAFAHMYWRVHALPVVTVRPFQVYGPGQAGSSLIPSAVRTALQGEDFAMTAGQQQRDFVYVDDVVEGFIAAAEVPGVAGESFDLGSGTTQPLIRVVERIWALTGATGVVRNGALPYRAGEAVEGRPASAARTAQVLGWRAVTSLDEGLLQVIDWNRRLIRSSHLAPLSAKE